MKFKGDFWDYRSVMKSVKGTLGISKDDCSRVRRKLLSQSMTDELLYCEGIYCEDGLLGV